MSSFSPPGFVNDLPADGLQQWSAFVQKSFNDVAPFKHFFSPFSLPAGQQGISKLVPWNGFPKKYTTITNPDPMFRYKAVEEPVTKDLQGSNYRNVYSTKDGADFPSGGVTNFLFRDQDEYLEWKTFKNPDGSIQKIVFTCDHPEYWKFIGEFEIDLLVKLYQQYVNVAVVKSDLLFTGDIFEKVVDENGERIVNMKGKYNPFNKWNTTHGIMHLTHPANYLSAEIQLAAQATVLRKDAAGHPITDPDKLIKCSGYGNPLRSSDPKIGSDINTLVRNNLSVSISDPVALYIHDVKASNFVFPAGLTFADCWKVTRGDAGKQMILRAEFSIPSGSGVKIEDIKVNGKPLQFGGQIADAITMAIFGLGFHFTNVPAPVLKKCGDDTLGMVEIAAKTTFKIHTRN